MKKNSLLQLQTIRLKPGQDLKQELQKLTEEKKLKAASIVTAVGSLTQAKIRFANMSEGTQIKGPFEIVSLVGTVSTLGTHLHIAVSDSAGKTLGGHLVEGNIVYTTCEITVVENQDLVFDRQVDSETGYKELFIRDRSQD